MEGFNKGYFIDIKFDFSVSHIVSYFVSRSVSDGQPADDFKAINKSAKNLFICGHIQCIEIYTNEDYFLLKARDEKG